MIGDLIVKALYCITTEHGKAGFLEVGKLEAIPL